jgi:hypothetical protein
MIDGLRDTLKNRPGVFHKVCLDNGIPIRFTGWILEQATPEKPTNVRDSFRDQAKKEHYKCDKGDP